MYEKDNRFIEILGSDTAVAKLCGITRGAVSQWEKLAIPKAQLNYLKTLRKEEYLNTFISKN